MNRPSPHFTCVTVVIALALFGTAVYMVASVLLYEHARTEDITQRVSPVVQDWRPDISHCFEPDETRELWDCIRHVEVN